MDIETVRLRARAALQNLEAHRQRINDLNVYPVPDGDTGTNLASTVRAVVEALDTSTASGAEAVAHELSRAALMGARGNSGVILSQIVRGFADVLGRHVETDAEVLAQAFRSASDTAYRGVQRPVEGTMLTVIREMAEEAERADVRRLDKVDALRHVVARGEEAVARTPELLQVLAEAGVVDAGGAGLLELVRGVYLSAAGLPLPDAASAVAELTLDAVDHGDSLYRYCTNFVVAGSELDRDGLYDSLASIGDSLHVVGDEQMLRVHVHTDDPEHALALGGAVGAILAESTEISDMHEQIADRDERVTELVSREQAAALQEIPTLQTAVVAVVLGRGIAGRFAQRASRLVEGGQTLNPSVGELVEAIESAPGAEVVVLPNNGNVLLSALEAVKLTSRTAAVVPSRSMQAGIVALEEGYDPALPAAENAERMAEALRAGAAGELTRASKDATVDGLDVCEGQWLALVDERAVVASDDLDVAVSGLVDHLLPDGGVLEAFVGAQGPDALEALERCVAARGRGVELNLYEGGQPHYPLLLWSWHDA